jgi:hypothetical protein
MVIYYSLIDSVRITGKQNLCSCGVVIGTKKSRIEYFHFAQEVLQDVESGEEVHRRNGQGGGSWVRCG